MKNIGSSTVNTGTTIYRGGSRMRRAIAVCSECIKKSPEDKNLKIMLTGDMKFGPLSATINGKKIIFHD